MIKTILRSILILLLALALALPLASCNKGETPEETPLESVSEWEPETTSVPETEKEEIKKCVHKYKNGYCTTCGERGDATEDLHLLSNGDGTWRVSGVGECTDIYVVIPLKAPNGEPVTKIGYRAFAWYETMETIVIHENITVIEVSAFHDCLRLEKAEFEDPEGWYCNGKPINLSNPRMNVDILLSGAKLEKLDH